MKKGKGFSQAAGALIGNVLKNVLFTSIFVNFIKLHGR